MFLGWDPADYSNFYKHTLKFSKQITQLTLLRCIVRNWAIKSTECDFYLNLEKARSNLWCQQFCCLHSPKGGSVSRICQRQHRGEIGSAHHPSTGFMHESNGLSSSNYIAQLNSLGT